MYSGAAAAAAAFHQQQQQQLAAAEQQHQALVALLQQQHQASPSIQDLLSRARQIKSSHSAFVEVAEIKTIVYQLLLSGGGGQSNAAIAAILGDALQQQQLQHLASNNSGDSSSSTSTSAAGNLLNGSRKRVASFGLSQSMQPPPPATPTQTECPLPIRPLAATCQLASPFLGAAQWTQNWPLIAQALRTSPALAAHVAAVVSQADMASAAAAAAAAASATDNKQWSSPSSVESNAHKTDSITTGESNIDPVGIDGSESSSSSSTCTQAMMSSPPVPAAAVPSFMSPSTADMIAFALRESANAATAAAVHSGHQTVGQLCQQAMAHSIDMKPLPAAAPPVQSAVTEARVVQPERKVRKQISDDYVKLIRQHDLSGKKISDIQIPVPEALQVDPNFNAVSEQQIVQAVVGNKKFDEMDAKDATTQLCKKLAEKRVFGPRLMAKTTVAGPNHSTYSNLPDDGIIYIQHVCRQVLKDKLHSEEEFWDVFREAMRKLAARCRRVRHAKKTKTLKESGQNATAIPAAQYSDPLAFFKREPAVDWAEAIRNMSEGTPSLPKHSDLTAQVAAVVTPKFDFCN